MPMLRRRTPFDYDRSPMESRGRLSRCLPFLVPVAAVTVMGFMRAPSVHLASTALYYSALGVAMFLVASPWLVPWRRLPARAHLLVPALMILAFALARYGWGEVGNPLGLLVLFPVLWAAAYGTRADVLGATGLSLLPYVLPAVIPGMAQFDVKQGPIYVIFAFFTMYLPIAWVLNSVVLSLRNAEQELRLLGAMELHDDILQRIVVARMALDAHQPEMAEAALEEALDETKQLIDRLLGPGKRKSYRLQKSTASSSEPEVPITTA